MKKTIITILIILALIIIILGYYAIKMSSDRSIIKDDENKANNQNTNLETKKTFVLTGENFKFMMNGIENPELRVKQGDLVRIEFTSIENNHDWVIDDFDAATEQVNPGKVTSVEFIADKKGTFEYYCSVGNHRNMGMKGRFIVE